MTKRGWCLGALALSLLVAQPAAAKVYNPTTYTLANGLRIIVVPNHRAAVVHEMIWYRVGAVDEEPGKSGLAHYLEHLMFKGTPSVPAGAYSKALALQGGNDNAFTSHDYTAYFATVPASYLPQLMWMEADRMHNLALTAAVARPELDVVLAERRQRTDDDPQGRFAEKMQREVFGDHPYGRPVIGWRQEVEAMTDTTATAFYKKWYAPNNAILIISGDVTPERVAALAAATFGRLTTQTLPERRDLSAVTVPHHAAAVVTVKDPDVQQPLLERVYIAPSYHAGNNKSAYALEVLEEILDGGEVGRLYRQLVVQQKLATGVDAGYTPSARDRAEFTLALSLAAGVDHERANGALDHLLQDIVKHGVTQSEVTQAIKRLQRQSIFARDSLMAPGYAFGVTLATGGTITDVENWPARIGAVKLADVNNAARRLFAHADDVTGYLLPADGKASKRGGKIHLPQGEIR
jgi:zinc protease